MRVLGVDPGLTRCGVGVIDGEPGRRLSLVGTDVIRTAAGDDIGARLLALEVELDRWLIEHQPDAVAVERVFSQQNVRTVMGTAQAGAVAIVCAARRGVPVAMHTPSEVKAAVTGSGAAGKAQVTEMVMRLLRLANPPKESDDLPSHWVRGRRRTRRRRHRGRRRGFAGPVHTGDIGAAAGRRACPGSDVSGCPRGLAHPVWIRY